MLPSASWNAEAHAPPSLELAFASGFAYAPRGSTPAATLSRKLGALIKDGDPYWIGACARRVGRACQGAEPDIAAFFDPNDLLVPVPGCRAGCPVAQSVTRQLAERLVASGAGAAVWCGLARVRAVVKSATAACGRRPSLHTQWASLRVVERAPVHAPAQFLLIDDVVTRGTTLLAAAMRLREAYPHAPIRGFALLRTLGGTEIERLWLPCRGLIRCRRQAALRLP